MNTCEYNLIYETETTRFKIKPFWKQVYIASAAWNLGFLYGMSMGTNTVAIPQMINESIEVSDEMRSWLGSVFGFGSLSWILIITPIINWFGVKKALLSVYLAPLLGSTVIWFATSSTHFFLGQLIQSMLSTAMTNVTMLVLNEYVSPDNRSIIYTIKSASIYWGIWLANAIGTFFNWRYIAVTSIVCSLYGLTVFLWPESPYWLAGKGRLEECANSFRWIRGSLEETESELKKIMALRCNDKRNGKNDFIKLLKSYWNCLFLREFYMPLFLSFMLIFLYLGSGKFACTIYAIEVLKSIISDTKWAYTAMLILDGANVLGMYCGCYIAKKFKRKYHLLTFSSIGTITLYLLALYLFLVKYKIINGDFNISLLLLIIFSLAICIGPFLLNVTIMSELVPLKNKLHFCNYTTVIGQLTAGASMKMAPYIFNLGLHVAFLIYAIITTLAIIVLAFSLPETKGKTLFEINEGFKKPTTKIKDHEAKLMSKCNGAHLETQNFE